MQTISSYKTVGTAIHIYTPYSKYVVETCRKWSGKYDGGKWVVPASRIEDVKKELGSTFDDLVEVEVKKGDWEGCQQIQVGWYVLAGRRSRDYGADVYAELVAGEIPASGGSVKNPSVDSSTDAKFRLWVPRDFAVARNLTIVTDPKDGQPVIVRNPLEEFSDEQLLAEVTRRGLLATSEQSRNFSEAEFGERRAAIAARNQALTNA